MGLIGLASDNRYNGRELLFDGFVTRNTLCQKEKIRTLKLS